MAESERNELTKNIERVYVKIGFDEQFLNASVKHLNAMQKFCAEEYIPTRKEVCNTFLSKLFMDNIDTYPCKRKDACQVEEHFDPYFKTCPSEIFGQEKLPVQKRIEWFIESLKCGDVLDCQVVEVLSHEYRLKVLVKNGSPRLLCDLNITVSLPRNEVETALLKTPLNTNEFIRVLVQNEHTTVNEEKFSPQEKNIKLGRISKKDLPNYVFNKPTKCSTLVDYLKTQPIVGTVSSFNNLLTSSGLGMNNHYSYYPKTVFMKDLNYKSGQTLIEEALANDQKDCISLALKEQRNGNYEKALEQIEEALKISQTSKLYIMRWLIHCKQEKTELSKSTILDLELAYQLDKNNPFIRQTLSTALTQAAMKFYKSKKFPKAVTAAEKALMLDKSNKKASSLLKQVKKRYCPENANQQQVKRVISEQQLESSKLKKGAIDEQQEENVKMLQVCSIDK